MYVSIERGRMHYLDAGSGVPVLLVHGWPGSALDWEDVIEQGSRFARLIAPDLFGFGASDPLRDGAPEAADEDAFARDLLDLMDALEIDASILVGFDIGSAVAPAVARLAADRVRALLLLNPTHPRIGAKASSPQMVRESWYQQFHQLPLASALLDGKRSALSAYLGYFYEHWGGKHKVAPSLFERTLDLYSRPGAFTSSVRWYTARAARRHRDAPLPEPIATPTIALWGDRDPMRPVEHREGFESAFPQSTSRVLPGVGHFVPFEAADDVTAALVELVDATS
jgi:pimeloyl-ACP methyl ester carboxylesterase